MSNTAGGMVGGTRKKVFSVLKTVFLFALLLVYMVPFFLVIINAFKSNGAILKSPLW